MLLRIAALRQLPFLSLRSDFSSSGPMSDTGWCAEDSLVGSVRREVSASLTGVISKRERGGGTTNTLPLSILHAALRRRPDSGSEVHAYILLLLLPLLLVSLEAAGSFGESARRKFAVIYFDSFNSPQRLPETTRSVLHHPTPLSMLERGCALNKLTIITPIFASLASNRVVNRFQNAADYFQSTGV